MNIKRLRHVVAVAEERNFARAAERVRLSQPALSRSIQAAEGELGFALFDRGRSEVTLTPAGAFVIERARRLVFESRCLERDIDLYRKTQIGTLAIGAGPFPAATILPALITDLRNRAPGVQIQVEVSNWDLLKQRVRAEELDFFLADVREVSAEPDLEVTRLARQFGGFYVRAGHPLLARDMPRVRDLAPFGLATTRLPAVVRSQLSQLLALGPGQAFPHALQCDDMHLLTSVAMHSDTVLGAVHAAVAAEVDAGRLVLLDLVDLPPLHSELGIVSLKGRSHSPVARIMIEAVRATALRLSQEVAARAV